MAELRLRELDNFLNSPIGKFYTAVVGMVFFYGGAKFIVKGIVDLGNGLAMAYGMDAATGQMIPVLVRSDGLVISEVIQSVSAGVAQVVTGITVNAFGELSTGDLTPGGRSLSTHGAERANERGFTPETIDSIIEII
ncbi:hypothetical protein IGJ55_002454 [Enterococcus sp. AZ170]|uniref:hypothetical protein n=1 Tax=unclassified Enterococcus TaxID=2608891 RepID=UPI003D2E3FB5